MVLGFIFRCLIHFELIFVYHVRMQFGVFFVFFFYTSDHLIAGILVCSFIVMFLAGFGIGVMLILENELGRIPPSSSVF